MLNVNELCGFGSGGSEFHVYWRLSFPSGSAAGQTAVTEAEMRATAGGADQCNGGTASSSGSSGSFTPDKAFDNSTLSSSYWMSAGAGACWLAYQFTTPVRVRQLYLYVYATAPGYGPSSIDLQYSDDGVNYTTVASFPAAAWAAYGASQTFTM